MSSLLFTSPNKAIPHDKEPASTPSYMSSTASNNARNKGRTPQKEKPKARVLPKSPKAAAPPPKPTFVAPLATRRASFDNAPPAPTDSPLKRPSGAGTENFFFSLSSPSAHENKSETMINDVLDDSLSLGLARLESRGESPLVEPELLQEEPELPQEEPEVTPPPPAAEVPTAPQLVVAAAPAPLEANSSADILEHVRKLRAEAPGLDFGLALGTVGAVLLSPGAAKPAPTPTSCTVDEYEARRAAAKGGVPAAPAEERVPRDEDDVREKRRQSIAADAVLGLDAVAPSPLPPTATSKIVPPSPETPQWLRKAETTLRNTPLPVRREMPEEEEDGEDETEEDGAKGRGEVSPPVRAVALDLNLDLGSKTPPAPTESPVAPTKRSTKVAPFERAELLRAGGVVGCFLVVAFVAPTLLWPASPHASPPSSRTGAVAQTAPTGLAHLDAPSMYMPASAALVSAFPSASSARLHLYMQLPPPAKVVLQMPERLPLSWLRPFAPHVFTISTPRLLAPPAPRAAALEAPLLMLAPPASATVPRARAKPEAATTQRDGVQSSEVHQPDAVSEAASPIALWPFMLSAMAMVLAFLMHTTDKEVALAHVETIKTASLSAAADAATALRAAVSRLQTLQAEWVAARTMAAGDTADEVDANEAVVDAPADAPADAPTPASARPKRRGAAPAGATSVAVSGRADMYSIRAGEGKLIITPVKRSKRHNGAVNAGQAMALLSPSHGISIEAAHGVVMEGM